MKKKFMKLISFILIIIIISMISAFSVSALNIVDDDGNVLGTSVLTSSSGSRIYTLSVYSNFGTLYYIFARIHLYDINGTPIDGGSIGGNQSSITLTKGNANIFPAYRNINSSIGSYGYVYYAEY